ncbi:MAG: hypothetical protein GY849_06820 [Deltaproteobacteria bacterium]|nr:hypothetical protein [Deltaproteobacteria bacterium]
MPIPFKLQKLAIESYTDKERKDKAAGSPFVAMFNPDSYEAGYGLTYEKAKAIGCSGSEGTKWTGSVSDEITITLLLDNTGVADYGLGGFAGAAVVGQFLKKNKIKNKVDAFLNLTQRINDNTHTPNFLTLKWGDHLKFDCRLKKVDIKYTLFDRSGDPLRAEMTAAFIADKDYETVNKLLNLKSPDVTHVRTIKAGDTLALKANEIYKDPSYYIKIAQANKLNNLRELQVGQSLIFPPIESE